MKVVKKDRIWRQGLGFGVRNWRRNASFITGGGRCLQAHETLSDNIMHIDCPVLRSCLSSAPHILLLCSVRVAKYCDEYVRLCVCSFADTHNSKNVTPNFTNFFLHVARGRGRRCDMLCTSGFTDDVMFSYDLWWTDGHGVVYLAGSLARRAGLLGPGAGCPATGLGCCRGQLCQFRHMHDASSELRTGGKSAIYDCLVYFASNGYSFELPDVISHIAQQM